MSDSPTAQTLPDTQPLAIYNTKIGNDLPSEWQDTADALAGPENSQAVADYLGNRHPNSRFFSYNGNVYQTDPDDFGNITKDNVGKAISNGYAYRIDPGIIASTAAGILPTAGSIGGATAGATIGIPGGPAALAGGMTGAGLGNVAGNAADQYIAKAMGVPLNINTPTTVNTNYAPFDSKASTYDRIMPININTQSAKQFGQGALLQGAGEAAGFLGKGVPAIPIKAIEDTPPLSMYNGDFAGGAEIPGPSAPPTTPNIGSFTVPGTSIQTPGLKPASNLATQLGDLLKNSSNNATYGDDTINLSQIAKGDKGAAAVLNKNLLSKIQQATQPITDAQADAMANQLSSLGEKQGAEAAQAGPQPIRKITALPEDTGEAELPAPQSKVELSSNDSKIANNIYRTIGQGGSPSNLSPEAFQAINVPSLKALADTITDPSLKKTIGDSLTNIANIQQQYKGILSSVQPSADFPGNIGSLFASSDKQSPGVQNFGSRLNYQATGPQMGATLAGQGIVRPLANLPTMNSDLQNARNAALIKLLRESK